MKIIEFYRPKDWTILYCDVPCCGPKVLPTFPAVYHQLGPALPGFYRAEDQMYWLSYPGVTFMFPISRDFAHMFRDERHFNMVLPCSLQKSPDDRKRALLNVKEPQITPKRDLYPP